MKEHETKFNFHNIFRAIHRCQEKSEYRFSSYVNPLPESDQRLPIHVHVSHTRETATLIETMTDARCFDQKFV